MMMIRRRKRKDLLQGGWCDDGVDWWLVAWLVFIGVAVCWPIMADGVVGVERKAMRKLANLRGRDLKK